MPLWFYTFRLLTFAAVVGSEETTALTSCPSAPANGGCSEDDIIAHEATETSLAEARFLQIGFQKPKASSTEEAKKDERTLPLKKWLKKPIKETTLVGFQPHASARPINKNWRHRHHVHSNLMQTGQMVNSSSAKAPTEAEKKEFVDRHNYHRRKHNVAPVEWDDDVAASAIEYASTLTSMVHSDSYSIPAPAGPAGENIYWSSMAATPSAGVDAWYSEIQFCQPSLEYFGDGCKIGKDGVTGHFTCMMWDSVTKIGCGFSEDGLFQVCRYKAGDQLDLNTPNMQDAANYKKHVKPLAKM